MNPMPLIAIAAFVLTALSAAFVRAQSPAAAPAPTAQAPSVQEPSKPSLPTSHPVEYPAPPVDGIFVSDSGVILSLDEQRSVNKAAALVRESTGLPVMVVTISSLEIMGAKPTVTLVEYGRELFNHWSLASAPDDRAVLLLLARNDRQACVILGSGWGTSQDAFKQRIEATTLIPTATNGGYASGLTRAVNEVGAMFTQAGYPKEMRGAPAGGVSGSSVSPGSAAAVPLDSPPPPSSLGWVAWVGIGLMVVIGALVAVIFVRGKSE